jgi:hypothetical protein
MEYLADEIEKLVRSTPGLTDMDLALALHERARSRHRIISSCRRLVAEGRIERQGRGGSQSPFTYYPGGGRPASDQPRADEVVEPMTARVPRLRGGLMIKLRRIDWGDGGRPRQRARKYAVVDARGERVGRMYRTEAVEGGHVWRWSVYGIAVTNHPPAGQAPTREAAQAAFKAAWAACEPR